MELKLKLLDEEIRKSVKKNAEWCEITHMLQKIKCCNYSKRALYTSRSKNILHFKNGTNCTDKVPKILERSKIIYFSSTL
ncbi:hypothetical protein GOY07_00285 [Wolbachia endosymbiont of Litomosoides sigmodontis]|uniref:hypothetical protein n=1 Tax=Wolbachia endosymbiont of Litomosoides sigmodontis TaxID=80850 RepID=UPI00158E9B01|nr:hypothetical protein [Wolbachia endosymbiont of Litomosoides sigmodontis]QKX02700.1 hypothetical protein GOY07_00285 [Wolbachia endosymbiont of Litomosoides sigmodontis]